jgi:dihydrofolate reductase
VAEISLFESLSLDGVMQAPGRPDEDTRDGFAHGGWAGAYADADQGRLAAESGASTEALLFGRRTYEDFYRVWPNRTDNPFTTLLDNAQKYVVSRTLSEPLPWQNSTLLHGEASETVARLKQQQGKDILLMGSGELAGSLIRHNLVDVYMLLIDPLVLGSGRRLLADDMPFAALDLVESVTTTTGVIIATYRPSKSRGQ